MAAATMHTEDVALFNDPPYNTAEDKISWIEYRPTFISQGGYSSMHFHIAGNPIQYIDLAQSELYVKLKVEKEDGTPLTGNQSALPIDLIFHTMWSSVEVSLNQSLVSSAGTNYMYKAAFECILNYNKNTKEIQLSSIGFTPDSGDYDSNIPKGRPNKAVNPGLLAREKLFTKGECEFTGPLLADICNQGRLIMDGVDVDIVLWPSKDPFRIMANPANLKCKITVKDIYLKVCKVAVNKYCMAGHYAGLQVGKGKYPMQKTSILTKVLEKGSFGETFEDIFQGIVPTRLVIGMVESEAYSGSNALNPLNFQNFNLESMGFYVDGEPTPRPPYRFNFEENQYLEGLLGLYKIVGKGWEDGDIGITRENYQNGATLVAFNVDPTTATDFHYLGIPKTGHTRLQIRLRQAAAKSITVIIYAAFPARMEIDEARNITVKGPKELLQELIASKQ